MSLIEQLMPQDVEAALVAHLAQSVGCDVGTRVPNPRPEKFVRVRRTGGITGRFFEQPTLLVECWATSEPDAFDIAKAASSALAAAAGTWITEDTWINDTEVGGLVNFDDPSTSCPRYQFTARLWLRLAPA